MGYRSDRFAKSANWGASPLCLHVGPLQSPLRSLRKKVFWQRQSVASLRHTALPRQSIMFPVLRLRLLIGKYV